MSETDPTPAADSSQYSLYYRHSGRAPAGALVLALALGIVAAIPASIIYAAGDLYIPFIYIRFLLGFGLGAVLGIVPASVMRWGRVRNNTRVMLIVLLVALTGYYFTWIAWYGVRYLRAGIDYPTYRLVIHPSFVGRLILFDNERGTWTMDSNSTPVSGPFLWIVWLCEAALVLWAALTVAKKIGTKEPFCETCGVWCGKPRVLGLSKSRDVTELRNQLESGQFAAAGPLQANPPSTVQWMAYLHHTCPTCGQLNTLTVNRITVTMNRKKRAKRVTKTVIDKLLLHPGEAEQLLTPPATIPAAPIELLK